MRVAYLCTDRGVPYGGTKGASVHLGEITRALAAEGAEVLVLVARRARGWDGEARPGLRVELVRRELTERLRRFDPEILVERFALHSVAGSRAARQLGIPHVVELNAPLVDEARRYRTLDRPEQAAEDEAAVLQSAALVLAVTSPLADYASSKGARRVQVLPNAVALDRFPDHPRSRQPADQPRAVLAGTLRPWHGVATLASAWRLLGSAAPRLLVVGDGAGREELEAVGAQVTGHVPYSRVPELLSRCDIGLAPYASDAPRYFSPLKLFDYLASGLAVVAADLPGVVDIVDERTAMAVPAGDVGALAAAVSALAVDASRRARLGRAGRALVEEGHTWAHRARTVLAGVGAGASP